MNFWLANLDLAFIYVILTASYDLVVARMGIFSMAHAAFFAAGAYTAALILTHTGIRDVTVLALASGVVTLVMSVPLSAVALRINAEMFIIASLGFAEIAITVTSNLKFFGYTDGIANIPNLRFIGISLDSVTRLTIASGIGAAITIVIVVALMRSRWGKMITATRDSTVGALSLGLHTNVVQLWTVALSAGLAGVAGALYVDVDHLVSPSQFGFTTLALILAMLGVGGREKPFGYVAGPLILTAIPAILTYFSVVNGSTFADVNQIIYGGAMIVAIRLAPGGVGGIPANIRSRVASKDSGKVVRPPRDVTPRDRPVESRPKSSRKDLTKTEPLLVCDSIYKRFGRQEVLRGVSFSLEPGVVTGLVGPNGCGKSTLFDIICGLKRQDAGRILLGTTDLGQTPAWRRQRLGIARTFQDMQLFDGMTVRGNLEVGFLRAKNWRKHDRLVEAVLDESGLRAVADAHPTDLSYGERRILSVARAYAEDARVVLLDEPASGLTQSDIPRVLAVIRRMAERGSAVCLVEHNMEVVSTYADEVVFVASGVVLATGDPSKVMGDPELAEIYFGEAADAGIAG